MTRIRPVTAADGDAWLDMRRALWPEGSEREHRDEITSYFAGTSREPAAVLIAVEATGRHVGFAELSIRPYAEGCESDRVAYLEGWYVVPDARRRGVGRALIRAAEQWAIGQECREFGSDALLDNHVSDAAHRALGFEEIAQLRCFKKTLVPQRERA
jgi:aminoglycoside 6'-N-acetyltransferase I